MTASPYQQALVIGMGRSGKAAASLLRDLEVPVRVYDQRADIDDLPDGCEPVLGDDAPPEAAFEGIDLLVLSPGVDPRPHLARQARLAPDARVHGELSLALEVIERDWPRLPCVLVTGTNGKSTVTALTGHLLASADLEPFVGGNLAVPPCEVVMEVRHDARPRPRSLVIECSSYQLETFEGFPTDVAMLLNLTPDHLDRYEDMAAYGAAKARIFRGLVDDGLALLDDEDDWTDRLAPAHPGVRRIGRAPAPHLHRTGMHATLVVDAQTRIPRTELPLAGRHNARNALFALAAARHLGISAEQCRAGLRSFEGLAHRMQRVGERDGVVFFDDSKATNVAAVLASLDGFERRFVLIAGGRAKGDDLGPLTSLLRAQAKGLVAIGESKQQFLDLAEGVVPAAAAVDMNEAVRRALVWTAPGDAVVLSPACASWDMYTSYAARGAAFAAAIDALDTPDAPTNRGP